ncbi:MAG TPA: MBL fold metallo-hydrolase, partial [Bacteroidia bacterium]
LTVLHTPGHSPGSVSFYSEKDNFVVSGDVLFKMSIGRTDLPMGNYEELIQSIRTKLLSLPGDCVVYSGHGPATEIGFEAKHNPFLV